jgi:hypothetical protein
MGNPLFQHRKCRKWYEFEGVTYPSVTTVLKAASRDWGDYSAWMVAKGVREHIYGRGPAALRELTDTTLVKGFATAERDRKAAVGNDLHRIAEAYAHGADVAELLEGLEGSVLPYAASLLDWLTTMEVEFDLTEVTLFSSDPTYAGTADAFCRIGGQRVLLDYKTSKTTYPEHQLQLSAYRYAEFYVDHEGNRHPVPEVDSCAILVVGTDGATLHPWTVGPEEFGVFAAVRALWQWRDSKPSPDTHTLEVA